ncbi:hypothetical protein AAFF_G00121940 [Aldrovandia affinis]|uniref:Uncharacterized protein n=1 Tax=Aldrovandia affinis TaxID=143900 RepID=A0AAD7RS01_9TELE|nr:hypothetical protein AAFF_G00121940 [Aldrovandia affinis]
MEGPKAREFGILVLVFQVQRRVMKRVHQHTDRILIADFERFVAANVEATKECVPTTERIRVSPRFRHPEVVQAHAKVEEARRSFNRERTTERRGVLNEAKQLLFSTYDKIKWEELMEKVRRVEAAQGEQQYGESWRVINEMSGRKRSKEGQVAGCSPEERVTSWFTHFRDLLGTHPTVDGAEKVITAVLTNLKIDDGPFTLREFASVKSTLKQGKNAGPDGIPPEALKNCDLDDIILEICNLALMENNKPDIWSLSNIIPLFHVFFMWVCVHEPAERSDSFDTVLRQLVSC